MSILVRGVTKLYGDQKALDNVSFRVETGEIVGFLGPNGAGKSTMMKIITGFIPPSSGQVFVNDIEIGDDNLEIRKQLGYLPENNPLYPDMYVREYLGFVASIYDKRRNNREKINHVIEITGLTGEQKKKIGSLSKGYRQRVGLAQALVHNPDVLILDEATTGLDPNQTIEIRNLIKEAGKQKTVMLSTHIMQEVEAICNRVIIIDKGIVVADETKDNIHSLAKFSNQIIRIEFDRDPGGQLLSKIPGAAKVRQLNDNTWLVESSGKQDIRAEIFNFAVQNNLTVLSLSKHESNLEEVFRHLTNQ